VSIKPPAEMAATITLREALNQGISSGKFVDTKIILYSHRDSSGRVCRPKALYANSHVLKTVPYFNDREHIATPNASRSKTHGVALKVLFGTFTESQLRDFTNGDIDAEESAEDYGYLSDSDLEDDEDDKAVSTIGSKVHPLDKSAIPSEGRRGPCEEHDQHVEKGKIVKIPDMAFLT